MFFEAPGVGFRKMTYDVTKVTYYIYSCDTCCKSREMMEMDRLDNAKCQKSKQKDTNGINTIVNEEKTKLQ